MLFKCLTQPFLAAAILRIFLAAFRCSQPVLINRTIDFLKRRSEGDSGRQGYWIVYSATAIYFGLAVSFQLP